MSDLTTAEHTELHDLALEIADHQAPSNLECNLLSVSMDGDRWYDLESMDPDEKTEFAGEIRYCELRGLLRHHSGLANLIQTLEP